METIIRKEPYGEIVIIKFQDEITFHCSAIGLDAIYNIETGKIKGKGSKACKVYILKEVEEILKIK